MMWLRLLSGPLALSGLLMLLLLLLLPPLSLLEDSVSQESWKMGFLLLLLVWGGVWLSSSLPFLLLFLIPKWKGQKTKKTRKRRRRGSPGFQRVTSLATHRVQASEAAQPSPRLLRPQSSADQSLALAPPRLRAPLGSRAHILGRGGRRESGSLLSPGAEALAHGSW